MSRTRLQAAIDRVERSRKYTSQFLSGLSPDDWFWHPQELTTHIAWQVGHIAVSQYNLCLRRVRGRTADDEALISDAFIDRFKLASQPVAGAENNPPLEEIRRVFEGVYRQALSELAHRTDAELDTPTENPHPAFQTKLEAVDYAHQHELVHAGQIALLRRLMGRPPLR